MGEFSLASYPHHNQIDTVLVSVLGDDGVWGADPNLCHEIGETSELGGGVKANLSFHASLHLFMDPVHGDMRRRKPRSLCRLMDRME